LAIIPCFLYRLAFNQTLGKNEPKRPIFYITICFLNKNMNNSGGVDGMRTWKMALIY
jgi:hypothetical protein